MCLANKMARDDSKGVLPDVVERQVFQEKELETTENSVQGYFWKIVVQNTDVLEPTLLLEIDNCSFLFKMRPKPIHCLRVLLK